MLAVAVVEERAAAGATVHGRLEAPPGSAPVAIELVRIEQSPAGSATFSVASAELDANGSFSLVVPEDAPPAVTGPACALHYVLRAHDGGDELRWPLEVVQ
ncbi:MAG: hypothetical protein ABI317_15005 [Gaiellales bacterium]